MLKIVYNTLLKNIIMDPLEQFYVTGFAISEAGQLVLKALPYKHCPWDIVYYVMFMYSKIVDLLETTYFAINVLIAPYFTSTTTLLILWVIFVLFFENNTTSLVNTNVVGKTAYSENKKFNLFTSTSNLIVYFFNNSNTLVKNILKANTLLEKNEYFLSLFFLFLFITLCNVGGLIPYTFTLTSSFIVTFFFAANYFIGINIIAVYKNGLNFFNMFTF